MLVRVTYTYSKYTCMWKQQLAEEVRLEDYETSRPPVKQIFNVRPDATRVVCLKKRTFFPKCLSKAPSHHAPKTVAASIGPQFFFFFFNKSNLKMFKLRSVSKSSVRIDKVIRLDM